MEVTCGDGGILCVEEELGEEVVVTDHSEM